MLRNSLGLISTPLLIRNIGLTNILNQYFAAVAVVTSVYVVLAVPIDIYYSPALVKGINHNGPRSLRRLSEEKISLLLILFLIFSFGLIVFYSLSAALNSAVININYRIYFMVIINVLLSVCCSTLLIIKRFEKRIVEASLAFIINTILASIVPLLFINNFGIFGYLTSSFFLQLSYLTYLFVQENLKINNIFKYKLTREFVCEFFHLLKLSFFTKGFSVIESATVSLFFIQDATLYFLAKKIVSQVLSVVSEGRNRIFEAELAISLNQNNYTAVKNILKKVSAQSAVICCLYVFVLYLGTTQNSVLSYIFKINVEQMNMLLTIALTFSVWLYSSLDGGLISFVFYSLDMTSENRRFLISSAIFWSFVLVVFAYFFGIYSVPIALGAYFLFNNKVLSRKITLKL